MSRVVVNVATDSWIRMQDRLIRDMHAQQEVTLYWRQCLPPGSPPHREAGICAATNVDAIRPFAFKAYALKAAADAGYTSLLWCDSCIIPLKPLAPLWERIERDGYWICENGWSNFAWTAESAYDDLFELEIEAYLSGRIKRLPTLRTASDYIYSLNTGIPHVVATAFGLSLTHPTGRAIFDEYFRLASQTRAFCGPWVNTNNPENENSGFGYPRGPCGPPHVRGHRHDQTALSVIAWRCGCVLDKPPAMFCYTNPVETTVLQACKL